MYFREWTARNGRHYKAFVCPHRDCAALPIWVSKGELTDAEICQDR